MMSAEIMWATNNAYDSVLYIVDGVVVGEWMVTPDIARAYLDDRDSAESWSATWPDETAPEAYGEILGRDAAAARARRLIGALTARDLYDSAADHPVVLADGPGGPVYWMCERDGELYVYDDNDVLIAIDDDVDIASDVAAWVATMRAEEARRGGDSEAYTSQI